MDKDTASMTTIRADEWGDLASAVTDEAVAGDRRDGDVFRRARAGDRTAQALLLRDLQDVIWRFCLSTLRDRELALDASQETALRVLRSLKKFKGRSQLRTWVLGIALNVCREARRKRPAAPGPADTQAAPGLPPDALAARREQHGRLSRLLDTLSPRRRQVIALRYFEGLSVEETARVMGAATGTVKALTFQALRVLRRRWEDQP